MSENEQSKGIIRYEPNAIQKPESGLVIWKPARTVLPAAGLALAVTLGTRLAKALLERSKVVESTLAETQNLLASQDTSPREIVPQTQHPRRMELAPIETPQIEEDYEMTRIQITFTTTRWRSRRKSGR
ncbi:MAG: hypothetical protein SF029_02910 [bacterium]|nr:hypothetical protein [bacterium]